MWQVGLGGRFRVDFGPDGRLGRRGDRSLRGGFGCNLSDRRFHLDGALGNERFRLRGNLSDRRLHLDGAFGDRRLDLNRRGVDLCLRRLGVADRGVILRGRLGRIRIRSLGGRLEFRGSRRDRDCALLVLPLVDEAQGSGFGVVDRLAGDRLGILNGRSGFRFGLYLRGGAFALLGSRQSATTPA